MKYLFYILSFTTFNLYSQSNLNEEIDRIHQLYWSDNFNQVIYLSDSLLNLNILETNDIESLLVFKSSSQYYLGDYFGTLQTISKISYVNQNYSLLKKKGDCKLNLKDYYGAIVDYTNSIEVTNRQSLNNVICLDIYLSRAECYFKLNKLDLAAKDYTSVINFPGVTSKYLREAYFFRGLANNILGNKEQACKDFSKSMELGEETAIEAISKYCN